MREQLAREQVFFKRHHIGLRRLLLDGQYERAHPRRRLKHLRRGNIVLLQDGYKSVRYLFRGIERGQHGGFQRIHITFVFRIVLAVVTYQTVQFHRHREQFEVGFRPIHGIGQRGGRIEDAFQPPETTVAADNLPFFGGSRPVFPVQHKRCPYSLDVSPQSLLAVKCHARQDKWLRLRSVPCIDGHIRATGRSRLKADSRRRFP